MFSLKVLKLIACPEPSAINQKYIKSINVIKIMTADVQLTHIIIMCLY